MTRKRKPRRGSSQTPGRSNWLTESLRKRPRKATLPPALGSTSPPPPLNRQRSSAAWLDSQFKKFVSAGKSQRSVRSVKPTSWKPQLHGKQVDTIESISNAADYVLVPLSERRDIVCVIRQKKPPIKVRQMPVEAFNYSLTIRHAPQIANVTVQEIDDALTKLLHDFYGWLYNMHGHSSKESLIQLELIHPKDNKQFPSQPQPFTRENGQYATVDILEGLLSWVQSVKPDAELDELELHATIVENQLAGQGKPRVSINPPKYLPKLLLDDGEFQLKKMQKYSPKGSILYVKVEQGCFYVAMHFALAHHFVMKKYQDELKNVMTPEQHKSHWMEQMETFWQTLDQESDETILKNTEQFFNTFGLNIHDFDTDHESFLQSLIQILDIQVSVYDASKELARIYISPEEYDPMLPQVSLLRCTIPAKVENCARFREDVPHFHGLRSNSATLVGRGLAVCCYCGNLFSHNVNNHLCKSKKRTNCSLCLRPTIDMTSYLQFSLQGKTHHCLGTNGPATALKCKLCNQRLVV